MFKELSNVDPESCSRLDVQCLMQVLEAHLRQGHEVRARHDPGAPAVRARDPGGHQPGVIPGQRPAQGGPGGRRVSSGLCGNGRR